MPITSETLAAVRALTAWVLHREQAIQVGLVPPPAPEALRKQLEVFPAETLLKGIRRHRLESLLHADPAVGDLLPCLQVDLQHAARRELMSALALASLTREIAVLFGEAGIPLLVIKGIPLALQTTGSLTARGRGDCDLFVDPSQVGEAISLLQEAGFVLSNGASCVGEDSWRGSYSRFISIQISLRRLTNVGMQWIDLHWQAAHALGVLPGFQELWKRREKIDINGQSVWTLSRCDAFIHGCCHAAADRWMFLRNLVDLERLALCLSENQMLNCRRQRLVRNSFSILSDCGFWLDLTSDLSGSVFWSGGLSSIRLARKTQLSCLKADENLIFYGLRNLNLSLAPHNLLAKILLMLAPPDVLISSASGKHLSIPQIAIKRFEKLIYQIRTRNSASSRCRNAGIQVESLDPPD